MANVVIVGAQWGDEGKAKIVDLLANKAQVIIRYQGGCNAGHTVVTNGQKYKFHLIPSGVLYEDKISFIGAGTVIYPKVFKEEIDDLLSRNINLSNLKIHPLASVTMPYHIDLDGADEKRLQNNKIGTTKKGIGPTYTDKMARLGLKVQDLYDYNNLPEKIERILSIKNLILENVYKLKPYSKDEILSYCDEASKIFAPYVANDWQRILNQILKEDKKILFEGAQGVMLDVDFGTYPYVTSSNPIAGGAAIGSGVGPRFIDKVIGIMKAYVTRVGEGPFVTELNNSIGEKIQTIGAEFGTTTGRARRCGWFDCLCAKYAVLVCGLTNIAITKLDVFDTFDEIKICTAYRDIRTNEIYHYYQTDINIHKYCEPVYESVPGWKQSISDVKSYDDLPQNAKKYLQKLQNLINVPISIISVGPERTQTIILDDLF